MKDVHYLGEFRTPMDKLIDVQIRPRVSRVSSYAKSHRPPIPNLVTVDVVRFVGTEVAHTYLQNLRDHAEEYENLFKLGRQKMLVPLAIRFREAAELVLDPVSSPGIVSRLNELIGEFNETNEEGVAFDIARLELLYFFTLLVNPSLTWISLDYLVRGSGLHPYLIAARGVVEKKQCECK